MYRHLRTAGLAALLLLVGRAYAQDAATVLTADDRRAAITRLSQLLADRYVFADVGVEAGRRVRERLDAGAYDEFTDASAFADQITSDLQDVSRDRHMRVRPRQRPAGVAAPDMDEVMAAHRRELRAENYGFERVERLDGNVAYLKFDYFGPTELVRETAAAAMRMMAGADALIFDLRENGGGSPETVRFICSYLFGERTHLNSLYWREGDRTEEFWTLEDIPGERMPDVPVFVLTSNRTFSGAEEFAYNLRTRERATLVGETTGGGANPGGGYPLPGGLMIFVPEGRAINPVTGTNWEGTGVEPHVVASAEEALDVALPLVRAAAEAYRERAMQAEAAGRAALREQIDRAAAAAADGRSAEASTILGASLRSGLAAGLTTEDGINSLGYRFLENGDHAMAIAVFRFNVDAFPASFNTYDSLGEAYMEAGQRDLAVTNYLRSLELNPQNENGRMMLERLRGGG